MRIAVVGADGFIGSHVACAALAAGAAVTAVCVREPWRLQGIEHHGLELVGRSDWRNPTANDAVAFLAYEPPASYDEAEWRAHELGVNAAGALDVARRTGGRFVFTSSADVYGPWHEEPVAESVPPAPATPYAEAKLAVEEALRGEHPDHVSLRLGTVYGPSEHAARAIPSFIRAFAEGREAVVHGDGSDVRDYVYVGDAAAAVVAVCIARVESQVLNIGAGTGRSTLEICRAIARLLHTDPKIRFEPSPRVPSRLVLDPARAVDELAYRPRRDFETALAEEIEWLT
jgi:UDP-glucose 4-epimerase